MASCRLNYDSFDFNDQNDSCAMTLFEKNHGYHLNYKNQSSDKNAAMNLTDNSTTPYPCCFSYTVHTFCTKDIIPRSRGSK